GLILCVLVPPNKNRYPRDEPATETRVADVLLDRIEPFLPGIETEILDAAMCRGENPADLIECLLEAARIGHLEIEAVEFRLGTLILFADQGRALKFVEHRADWNDRRHVLAVERAPSPAGCAASMRAG